MKDNRRTGSFGVEEITSAMKDSRCPVIADGTAVAIVKGAHKGRMGVIVSRTSTMKSLYVEIAGETKPVLVRKTSVELRNPAVVSDDSDSDEAREDSLEASQLRKVNSIALSSRPGVYKQTDVMSIPESPNAGFHFGSVRIGSLYAATSDDLIPDNFLRYFLRNRIVPYLVDMSENVALPPKTVVSNHSRFEIVAAKVKENAQTTSFAKKCSKVELMYCQTAGPGLEEIDIGTLLDRIANFSTLHPRKAAARLELFQSPVLRRNNLDSVVPERGIFSLPSSSLYIATDNGNDGCGFIEEQMLESLLGNNKYARMTVAVQVRIFSPGLGIFKGMLMRKRGITGIELQPSMLKVGPSLTNSESDDAILVINKAGRSPSKPNEYIGRLINPHLTPPPKTFDKDLKPLNKSSDMITNMFIMCELSESLVLDYVKSSRRRDGLRHAYVVGVADPTNSIPFGQVFITGFKHIKTYQDKVIVSRSPCINNLDMRTAKTVVAKPRKMNHDEWEWLNSLPFGVLVFPNPPTGTQSMPEQIANGDLDGDRYFICWDDALVGNIVTQPIEERKASPDTTSTAVQEGKDPSRWFSSMQEMTLEMVGEMAHSSQLIGLFWKLSGNNKVDGMETPDSRSFGDAYKQSLEMKKHGGKVKLPAHLLHQVPARLLGHLEPCI